LNSREKAVNRSSSKQDLLNESIEEAVDKQERKEQYESVEKGFSKEEGKGTRGQDLKRRQRERKRRGRGEQDSGRRRRAPRRRGGG
jgi:hypothetical protein